MFRLKNKGIRPVRGSVTGDLYYVQIETPVNLTSKQKELLRVRGNSLRRMLTKQKPRRASFDKLKDFFEK